MERYYQKKILDNSKCIDKYRPILLFLLIKYIKYFNINWHRSRFSSKNNEYLKISEQKYIRLNHSNVNQLEILQNFVHFPYCQER